MIDFYVEGDFITVAEKIEKIMGPKKFHLHNRIGNEDWHVLLNPDRKPSRCLVMIRDPKMATFVKLKL